MKEERWQRIEALFEAASLLPTRDAQAALILREAAGDPELGRQVLALIDHVGGAAERIACVVEGVA